MFKLFHKDARLDIRGAPNGVLSMVWDWNAIGNGTAGKTRVGMTDGGLEHLGDRGQVMHSHILTRISGFQLPSESKAFFFNSSMALGMMWSSCSAMRAAAFIP